MKNKKEILLQVKNLTVEFNIDRKTKFKSLDNVSFNIYKGETFGLVGESGSGKSTIARSIIRINPISSGEIIFEGNVISGKITRDMEKKVTEDIQMIFQDPMSSLNERAKVDYIVSEGILNLKKYSSEAERRKKVEDTLLEVGLLKEFSSRFPHEFSGGQRQRIGIARALIMEPKLIIGDEPISALDVSVRAQILNLLHDLQKKKDLTYLFIGHDLSVLRFFSHRIGVIYSGKILELAPTEQIFHNPIHPYTRALLSAMPSINPRKMQKNLLVYNPKIHDYKLDKAKWIEIEKEHFIWANDMEIRRYRKYGKI